MKIELQCDDTIPIPEGYKAIIKEGNIVFKKEFKKGDILSSGNTILIFKENHEDNISHFRSYYDITNQADICWIPDNENSYWVIKAFHHATEEEKQLLFDKMKEQGLLWNAEKKQVEKIRWRATAGKCYFAVNGKLDPVCYTDCFATSDTKSYICGNYFQTKEHAEEASDCIKETLQKYHEDLGY
ncbi:MAG: hypothetical protein HXM16_04635 [Fusobacterium periodonticum]|nr:hypothetical protein [Fusobacterium periodonticum]